MGRSVLTDERKMYYCYCNYYYYILYYGFIITGVFAEGCR